MFNMMHVILSIVVNVLESDKHVFKYTETRQIPDPKISEFRVTKSARDSSRTWCLCIAFCEIERVVKRWK